MASTTTQVTRGFRLRDLAIGCVILMIGGAMTYTVLTNGAGPYNYLAIYAFAVGGAMLVFALLGGAMLDKFTAKHPSLAKPHESPLVFSIIAFIGAFGLIYGWLELREMFSDIEFHSLLPW
jgi:hypothetical protein